MICVYLEGHDFSYEVHELLKVFYPREEIRVLEEKALVDDQSLLVESYLKVILDYYSIHTVISKRGTILGENSIDKIFIDTTELNSIKKIIKNNIKKSIFETVEVISDIKAPWGILTGIRPTKIVHELLDKNYEISNIEKILLDEYKISEDKSKLMLDVANIERKYIYPIKENKFSLYVSIPFCPTRCSYCSFPSNSLNKSNHLVDIYTENLIHEIVQVSKFLTHKEIDTVYIGGGTPTAIPAANLNKVIGIIHEIFGHKNIREFTVEAGRPDTITEEMLSMLSNNGIERISINPQTMNSKTLSHIGRSHSPDDIVNTFNMAKGFGFSNINMDVIVGLPEEGPKEIETTMEEILKLNPDNLTVHTMAIKRASKLREDINEYNLSSQQAIESMLSIVGDYVKKLDMYPYYMYRQKQILGNFENVGYTKNNRECIYNILMMEEKQTIIAVGAGGISKFFYPEENKIERVPNIKNLDEYIKRVNDMVEKKKKLLVNVDID